MEYAGKHEVSLHQQHYSDHKIWRHFGADHLSVSLVSVKRDTAIEN